MARLRLILRFPARRRATRSRILVALGLCFGVAAAAVFLYLHVAVRARFDGRVWRLPSVVYSDLSVLSRGDAVVVDELVQRLERSGYGSVSAAPRRPGQYRRQGQLLEIHLRGFATPTFDAEPRYRALRISVGRLQRIDDAEGESLRNLVVEPERLATLFGTRQEERDPLPLARVPQQFTQAVLAAEDHRFARHHGLDLRGIVRAAFTNLRHGRIVQGGSTITQQTIKNLYLDQERTWWRKAREALMALVLEARYPKDRILETYLNEVYWGQRGSVAICGAQAAARFYFGRDLDQLSLAESAMLAGLIRSPGKYNPFRHPHRARKRRDQVLEAMERLGWTGPDDLARARAEPVALGSGRAGYADAPYAVDLVRSRLEKLYDERVLQDEGLRIYTTIDTHLQAHADRAVRRGLERLGATARAHPRRLPLQAALVVTRPASGEVLALVGGRDYRESQFNRAVQARRQPGSCFKPFVFAAGFEQAIAGRAGLTPASVLLDEPLTLRSGGRSWTPRNYDRRHRGEVTARVALQESLNVPTVRAARLVGLDTIAELANRAGITSPLRALPSLALGSQEVTPLELACAYGTLADGGRRVELRVLRSVTDRQGRDLYRSELEQRPVLRPEAAYLVTDVLRGVFREGTARSAAGLGWSGDAAGKTGTTDEHRDAWFAGYTRERLALVWVGYDDNARTGLTGASGALPIWVEFMNSSGSHRRGLGAAPAGVVTRAIDPTTGLLAEHGCPTQRFELFASGTVPVRRCDRHSAPPTEWSRARENGTFRFSR